MRRRRSAAVFSFAFLDVFACALGSLIFILAACALRGQGLTRAAAAEMHGTIEDLRAEVAELESSFADAEGQRETQGWERDGLQQQIEVLQAQLEKAEADLQRAQTRDQTAAAEAQDKNWTWLRLPGRVAKRTPVYLECVGGRVVQQPTGVSEAVTELGAADSKVRALLKEVAGDPKRYAVVVLRSSGYQAYLELEWICRRLDVTLAREPLPDSVHVEGWR